MDIGLQYRTINLLIQQAVDSAFVYPDGAHVFVQSANHVGVFSQLLRDVGRLSGGVEHRRTLDLGPQHVILPPRTSHEMDQLAMTASQLLHLDEIGRSEATDWWQLYGALR